MATQDVQDILQELAAISTNMKTVLSRIEDHENRLRLIEGKGGKRWELVIGQVVNFIVAAGMGLLLGKLI